jgi:hypothetical protein
MIRRSFVALVAAAAMVSTSTHMAAASTQTVTQAIQAQDKIVHRNPGYRSLQNFHIRTAAQAEAAIPKFQAVEKLVKSAANAVAGATATSAQAAGQKDWVAGARGVARGIGMLVIAFRDIEHGKDAAAKAEALNALKTVKAGAATGTKGDKLLHLPTGD